MIDFFVSIFVNNRPIFSEMKLFSTKSKQSFGILRFQLEVS